MGEKSYKAAPYKMRNEAAWMVCEDPTGRVVMLTLAEQHAATLAELMNVAILAVPAVNYEHGKSLLRRTRAVARRSVVPKTTPET
jgi:ABC-type amino acid transport system permease subunit